MKNLGQETPEKWAQRTFGQCKLGDRRRTKRAVQLGAAIIRAPGKSLPQQVQSPAVAKATYRFLQTKGIEYAALMRPHWEATRTQMDASELVLLIQDLTEVDYTHYDTIEALGPIGDGRGRGYLLSTVLAVVPSPRQVLGIAYQEPFLRIPNPISPKRDRRVDRPREPDFWVRAVDNCGACPPGQTRVHVGDRGSDFFPFLAACRKHNSHFLIRAFTNRKLRTPDGSIQYLIDFARQLPAQDRCLLDLPAGHGHPARQVTVQLAFSRLSLFAPRPNASDISLDCWIIRVWEADPDPSVAEPIDWYLLTSFPTDTIAQAWERVAWYRSRWLVEDFHQCLKTGCQIEQRHLQHKDRLFRLLGLLAPVAVHLLSLREQARLEPLRPAHTVIPADLLRLVAYLSHRDPQTLTLHTFWRLVAQQGGYLGRKRDGPPGWKSLWMGWVYLQTLLDGMRFAADLDA